MKEGIIYPIIVAVILAIAGIISACLGLDFYGLFSALCIKYLREASIIAIAFILIATVLIYGSFKWFFKEKLRKADEMKQKLKDAEYNLSSTEKAYNELLETYEDLKVRHILKKYKEENK